VYRRHLNLTLFQSLALMLILMLGTAPAHAAASAAELCAQGTGIPRENLLVCTRALILARMDSLKLALQE
jgi:hypothetical protein